MPTACLVFVLVKRRCDILEVFPNIWKPTSLWSSRIAWEIVNARQTWKERNYKEACKKKKKKELWTVRSLLERSLCYRDLTAKFSSELCSLLIILIIQKVRSWRICRLFLWTIGQLIRWFHFQVFCWYAASS